MASSVLNLFILACFVLQADTARILCVFPFPAVSHQNVFRAYNKEMARRGHELVVITPNPTSPNDKPSSNVTEIDVSHLYQILINLKTDGVFLPKRGVIIDKDGLTSEQSGRQMIKMMVEQFNHPEVKKLIANRHKEKFDLVIVESLMYSQAIYGHLFNAPTILFSSLIGYPDHFETMGAVSRHPILYPHLYKHKYRDFNFYEKIMAVYDEFVLWRRNEVWNEIENEELKRIFGNDAVTLAELKDRADMLFLNAHPIMGNNRPVPPNVIYLGAGLHLQPVKELPKDLKAYLDSSKRGVVYVSLGTNVPTSLMDKDLLDAFLNAFTALPYDILWKLDENNLPPERISNNIKIDKWFPQRDMLMHPNIKAFVTQGGLQSTDEAIDAQVPLVGIPMLGDQWYNTDKYVELGIGVQLDSFTMNADDIFNGVTKAVTDARDAMWDSIENEELKRVFEDDFVPVEELKNRVDMLFLNAHTIMGNNRPVPPNVIYLGAGLHLQPVKELPKDLKAYLDNSKKGVVYVSLGTNILTSQMDEDLLDAFLNAFAALPYDILWKLDPINIPPERLSDNVKIEKWFPQRDMLMHPNIKAFVTQGGLQSTDEAIDAQVPVVGMPMLADQWYNTDKYVQLEIGVQMDSFTMNADDLVKGINDAVNNPNFRKNLKELREVMYDNTQKPIEKAAWWSEYVIRHGGAKHLRSPAANLSYYEYFMVDLLLCIASIVIVMVLLVLVTLNFVMNQFKSDQKKLKKN